jgi:hypothetical protein
LRVGVTGTVGRLLQKEVHRGLTRRRGDAETRREHEVGGVLQRKFIEGTIHESKRLLAETAALRTGDGVACQE